MFTGQYPKHHIHSLTVQRKTKYNSSEAQQSPGSLPFVRQSTLLAGVTRSFKVESSQMKVHTDTKIARVTTTLVR